jgi:hypothetical protein
VRRAGETRYGALAASDGKPAVFSWQQLHGRGLDGMLPAGQHALR